MSKTSHQKHAQKKHHHTTKATPSTTTYHADYQAHGWGDFLIVLLILAMGLFFILPFYVLIPPAAQMFVLILFGLTVLVFAVMLWRKKPADMAISHPQTAGHLVYLAAVVTLATIIILQLISGHLDYWLVLILAVIMITHSVLALSHQSK